MGKDVINFSNYLKEEFLGVGNRIGGDNTFYKIINKDNMKTWLDKNFIPDKKTMVTCNRAEVDEINPTKTAVELSNVPAKAIIDVEGDWAVVELFPVKNVIEVRPVQ